MAMNLVEIETCVRADWAKWQSAKLDENPSLPGLQQMEATCCCRRPTGRGP